MTRREHRCEFEYLQQFVAPSAAVGEIAHETRLEAEACRLDHTLGRFDRGHDASRLVRGERGV